LKLYAADDQIVGLFKILHEKTKGALWHPLLAVLAFSLSNWSNYYKSHVRQKILIGQLVVTYSFSEKRESG